MESVKDYPLKRIIRPDDIVVAMSSNTTLVHVIPTGSFSRTRCIPDDIAKHYLEREPLPRALRYIMDLGSFEGLGILMILSIFACILRDVTLVLSDVPCCAQLSLTRLLMIQRWNTVSPVLFGGFRVLFKVRYALSLTCRDNFDTIDQ
jgi:hypothetical protein